MNIASALKAEISHIARKEVRADTQGLKKAIAPYRSEIASLKRRTQALEQQIRQLTKAAAKATPPQRDDEHPSVHRFSAKGLAKHRQRLGLSQKDFGALVGASSLSIYKWEKGEVRPRAKYLAAIASIRTIGKKEAAKRLGLDPS